MTARPLLTAAQGQQLRRLLYVKALDFGSAATPYDHTPDDAPCGRQMVCNALVLGKLRDFGLTESRPVRLKGGSQYTVYWLTERGADEALAQDNIIRGAAA